MPSLYIHSSEDPNNTFEIEDYLHCMCEGSLMGPFCNSVLVGVSHEWFWGLYVNSGNPL